MSTLREPLERYWEGLGQTLQNMPLHMVARVGDILLDCYRKGGTVFVAGNGGSAATASHFACDLAKGTCIEGLPRFRVVPLTDNVPLLTAWGNDTSYDRIFAEQLENLAKPGDVLILISTSGNSPNVLVAAQIAAELGVTVVSWTGRTGGLLRRLSDLTVRAPSDCIEQVEDVHLVIAHSVCVAVRDKLRAEAISETDDEVITAQVAELLADSIS